jgi:hypothetical protein
MVSFALGSRLIISGLSKATQYNGCIAIVVSDLLPDGRQPVSLMDSKYENKKISVKPGNLKYESIKIEMLTIKQLKIILKGTGQELIPGSEVGDLRNQVSGMDVDIVAQILAKINLSPSTLPTLSCQESGKCAHCVTTPEAYQMRYNQISLLCQEVVKRGPSSDDNLLMTDVVKPFWTKQFHLVDKVMYDVSFAMAADWALKSDYKMARIAALHGLFMETAGSRLLDKEGMLKWGQDESKLLSDRGLICWLNKKIPCRCLNEARRQARKNLPSTGFCMMFRGCGMILPKTELMKCSGCKIYEYCSRDCQKAHWETHKEFCGNAVTGR